MKVFFNIITLLPLFSQASEYICEGSIWNFENKWKLEPALITLTSPSLTKEGNVAVIDGTIFTLYEARKNGSRLLLLSAQKDFGLKPYAEATGSAERGVIFEEKNGFVNNIIVCRPK